MLNDLHTSTTGVLNYGLRRPRLAWLARHPRKFIALALLIAVSLPAYWNWTEISLRARRWYWARQCLAHVMPQGTELLIYQNAPAVVSGNPDYMIDADPTIFAPASTRRMAQKLAFPRLPAAPAGYMPRVWKEYARLDSRASQFAPLPIWGPAPMNFLGGRKTPSGQRRLVAIAGTMVNSWAITDQISSLVLPLPGLFTPLPPVKGISQAWQWSGQFRPAYLKPAIADPDDPTHLTIEFTIPPYTPGDPERKGILDGYVRDDDTIEFRVRDPATTQGL